MARTVPYASIKNHILCVQPKVSPNIKLTLPARVKALEKDFCCCFDF